MSRLLSECKHMKKTLHRVICGEFFICVKLLFGIAAGECNHGLGQAVDVALLKYGVVFGVDTVHVQSDQFGTIESCNANTVLEISLIGGIDAFGSDHGSHAVLICGVAHYLHKTCAKFALVDLSGQDGKEVFAVGNAVEVNQRNIFLYILMHGGKGGGAKQADFLVVKEYKAYL